MLPNGVKAYSCSSTTTRDGKDYLTLNEEQVLTANTPYILYAADGCAAEPLTGWGTACADSYVTGLLTGVYASTLALMKSYVLQNHTADGVAFYQVTDGQPTVDPCRAYLTAPSAGSRLILDLGDATGIGTVPGTRTTPQSYYSLQGQHMVSPEKGLVIILESNGTIRKQVIKWKQ